MVPGEKAETALRRAEAAFGVFVTVHDLRGMLRRPDGNPLLPERHLHPHPLCLRGRNTETGWNARCYHDCYTASEEIADRELKPFVKTCWKGLVELVVPVVCDGEHLLTLYAGVFRGTSEPPETAPEQKWFHELYAVLPEPDLPGLTSLIPVLELLGQGIVAEVRNDRTRDEESGGRGVAIARFIVDHAHRPVTLGDLARHLHLSPTRAGHVVRELSGHSFQELLTRERMLRARTLLRSTEQKLEEVGGAVGFKNGYYFNRAFKKFFGETPGRFRRQKQ